MQALSQLREATSGCHRRLEKRLKVPERFADRDAYRAYLEGMLGFHAPFERALSEHPVRRLIADYDKRRKTVLLADDLATLGLAPNSIAAIPQCTQLPSCRDEAAALGSLYVLEGATLGGQVLLPMVELRLQLTRQSGASYLGSYGSSVDSMWQRFCATVEDWCTDDSRRTVAAAAAVATFESLEAWMCA